MFLASCYSRGISDINMFAENVDKFFFRGSLAGERKKKKKENLLSIRVDFLEDLS